MIPVVLASSSPTRAALLRGAGVTIAAQNPGVDEDALKAALRAEAAAPRDQADALAELKAMRVSARRPGALVIGADQVLDLDGEALDKPRDQAEARAQLARLRDRRHDLYSAAVIAFDGAPVWRHVARARLTMRRFSDAFLDDFLSRAGAEALATAGAYRLEGRGAQLFSRIDGDYFAILGLPLIETLDYLRLRGAIPE